jgi:hypothetical protein
VLHHANLHRAPDERKSCALVDTRSSERWPRVQVGSLFFVAGGYCSVLETANVDYRHQMKRWTDGERDARPRLRRVPVPHRKHDFLSFFGTFISFWGGWLYAAAACAQLLAQHAHVGPTAKLSLVQAPFLLGAMGFTAGGVLMAAESAHSWWWALLPPLPRTTHSSDLGRWIQFTTLLAAALYAAGAMVGFFQSSMRYERWAVANACTFELGTGVILVHSVLQTVEWFYPAL